MTQEKKKLSFWQIWNMSFGFLGIQFGFALQGGFMSRIFQTLGAEKDAIPSAEAEGLLPASKKGGPGTPAPLF